MNPSELVVKWDAESKACAKIGNRVGCIAYAICAAELSEALKEQELGHPPIPESELPSVEDIQAIYRSYKTTEPEKP